jgi:hypothetical protein
MNFPKLMKVKTSNIVKSKSAIVTLILISMLIIFRLSNVNEREISWDVLGYYLPLPATFIYDDPLMENRHWIEEQVHYTKYPQLLKGNRCIFFC